MKPRHSFRQRGLLIGLALALATGCQNSRSEPEATMNEPEETDEAQVNAPPDWGSATGYLLAERAEAEFTLATNESDARTLLAMEKCETLDGLDRATCHTQVDATHAVEETRAIADRDAALAVAKRQY